MVLPSKMRFPFLYLMIALLGLLYSTLPFFYFLSLRLPTPSSLSSSLASFSLSSLSASSFSPFYSFFKMMGVEILKNTSNWYHYYLCWIFVPAFMVLLQRERRKLPVGRGVGCLAGVLAGFSVVYGLMMFGRGKFPEEQEAEKKNKNKEKKKKKSQKKKKNSDSDNDSDSDSRHHDNKNNNEKSDNNATIPKASISTTSTILLLSFLLANYSLLAAWLFFKSTNLYFTLSVAIQPLLLPLIYAYLSSPSSSPSSPLSLPSPLLLEAFGLSTLSNLYFLYYSLSHIDYSPQGYILTALKSPLSASLFGESVVLWLMSLLVVGLEGGKMVGYGRRVFCMFISLFPCFAPMGLCWFLAGEIRGLVSEENKKGGKLKQQ